MSPMLRTKVPVAVNVGEARKAARVAVNGKSGTDLDADLLLAAALHTSREEIYAHPERPLTDRERITFDDYLRRRARREPLAYITGHREFYGLDLHIDRRVLIPRPATECLVERAVAWWRDEAVGANSDGARSLIVEAGTGCGAIALALAANLPHAPVVAGDRSADAALVATHNARRLNLHHRVHVVVADLQPPSNLAPRLVVANLPYVPSAEIGRLEPEIREYEPRFALDGGPDGFDLYRRFLNRVRVRAGGAVLLEIGHDQAPLVYTVATALNSRLKVEISRDLEGFDRVALIRGW